MWTKDKMPDLTGKTAIVTGANAGIGFETALALYEKGAHVILACRSLKNAEEALTKIAEQALTKTAEPALTKTAGAARIPGQKSRGTLDTAVLDLSSLASVQQFAKTVIQQHRQLHLLINNAGVMIPPASKTAEGWELQFGVNFLGHFALTGHLYPVINDTPGSRIVTVSSLAYLHGVIDFDNVRSERSYDPMREYSQSKLANLLFSVELQRRINAAGDRVLSVGVQPGANKTELARHMETGAFNAAVERVGALMDPWQGALPSLYAAVVDKVLGGALYGPDKDGGYRGYPVQAMITPNALDESVAGELWSLAEQVTGLHYPA
jgi:NAD(P)-dependent dehydrogenase (short-subunit alcohol dehydrogenase family)